MAARRVASSAVQWAQIAERVPVKQREAFRALKGRNDAYISKIQQLPEELPKVNFAYYKSHLSTPALVDEFEKMYTSMTIPYPKDVGNAMQQIEKDEASAVEAKNTYVASQKATIKESEAMINKLDSVPPPEEMTLQMFNYYFPEEGLNPIERPTFYPHTPDVQPDTTTKPFINTRKDFKNLYTHEEFEQMWWDKVNAQEKAKLEDAKKRDAAEASQIEGKK